MPGKITFTRPDTPVNGRVMPMISADAADVRAEAVSTLPHTTTLEAGAGDCAVVVMDVAVVAVAFSGSAPASGQGVPIPAGALVALHLKPGQKLRLEAL